MNERQKKIAALCDGILTSSEIAALAGDNSKYVQRTMLKFDLPRVKTGAQPGVKNVSWNGGRVIDRDGYVTVPTPEGYQGRKIGRISEHRLVMMNHLGRELEKKEVVDHIDGLTLHNCPTNLRLFENNAAHLKATISGQVPRWSDQGYERMCLPHPQRSTGQRVDSYRQRRARGDVRLQQIILAALSLGIDSPFLSGTRRYLTRAGILDLSRSNLERELARLDQLYV